MRTIIYSFLVLFLVIPTLKSQEPILTTADVSVEKLSNLFSKAYYTVDEKGSNYFVVKDVFPYYFDIDSKQRYVVMSINFGTHDRFSTTEVYDLVNKLNTEVALVKCSYAPNSGNLSVSYYFWTEGGFTAKSLIGAYKLFALASDLILTKDTKKIIK